MTGSRQTENSAGPLCEAYDYVRWKMLTEPSPPQPAAQYLRMSTEHQQYSLDNQAAAIAEYAKAHNFVVIRTNRDAGKSGLLFKERQGLRTLLNDVIPGDPPYKAILVYDVSRWGRFQDSDEAAHYEFLCKSAGVPVHYCAEQFANDGSVPSSIMKAIKRTMAAEYSRELGVKVYEGKKRLVLLGFHAGSVPGYGLRRMLISANGKHKQRLKSGEYKSISTDRVILVPGPKEEVRCVRDIYEMALRRKSRAWITRELNRRGVPWVDGKPWNWQAVAQVLKNPKYTGCNEWGRTAQKLHSREVRNPVEKRVVMLEAFSPIISKEVFGRVQKICRDRTNNKSNAELLLKLKRLLAKEGHLSESLIDSGRSVPALSTCRNRFGGIRQIYELLGYRGQPGYLERADKAIRTRRLHRELIHKIVAMFPGSVTITTAQRRSWRPMLLVDSRIRVSAFICPSVEAGGARGQWALTPVPWEKPYPALLCLLNRHNDGFGQFYLFPSIRNCARMKFGKHGKFLLRGKRLHSLEEFYDSVVASGSDAGPHRSFTCAGDPFP